MTAMEIAKRYAAIDERTAEFHNMENVTTLASAFIEQAKEIESLRDQLAAKTRECEQLKQFEADRWAIAKKAFEGARDEQRAE